MAGRFSVETVFRAIDRISRPVMRMASRVRRATANMHQGFRRIDKTTDKLLGNIKRIGLAAVLSFGLMSGAMADVIGAGADFEQTLVNAAVKFPGEIRKGTEAFKGLSDAARNTGRTTEFTAQQSAEAINFLATAGFNAEQALVSLPGIVDLATASTVDLGTASDIATDSLGAFNLMTKDSIQLKENLSRVNDVLAKTSTTSNTAMTSFFEAISQAGPVARSSGVGLETFAALAGTLATASIKGSRAGTTLKNTFLSLAAPSTLGAKVLKKLRVDVEDVNTGQFRDVIDILEDLNGALSPVGSTARASQLDAIFGKIPIAGVNILLAAGSDQLREYRKTIEGASGASTTMAGVMRDTVRGSLNALNSAIESVKITLFDMNSGPLKDAIDGMTEWVRINEKLIATKLGDALLFVLNNLEAIVLAIRQVAGVLVFLFAFSIAVKAIGAALLITQGIMSTFAFLAAGLPALLAGVRIAMLALNIAMFANPVGLIVGGIAALVGLAALVIAAWDPVAEFFGDIFDKVNGVISPALNIFGFGGDDDSTPGTDTAAAGVISPQDRTATNIERSMSSTTAQLNIAGAPEGSTLTSNTPTPGISLKLANSGGL